MSSAENAELRARAEARFKRRQEQIADAPRALNDYLQAQQDERDKTARLKALRLARAGGQ